PGYNCPHGKSQAMKLTAAMAMPTPKRTPARTRFEPPSPKAKVSPDTTIATRDRPRAMVLVKACWRTPTAFSQGELAWANAGAPRNRAASESRITREMRGRHERIFQGFLISIPREQSCIATGNAREVYGSGPWCSPQP